MPSTHASTLVWKVLCAALTPAMIAGAQGAPDRHDAQHAGAEPEIVAVRYVKAALDRQDPRIGSVGSLVLDRRLGSPNQPYAKGAPMRQAEHARALAAALGSRLDDGDTVLDCGESPSTCRMAGTGIALVRVSPAVVRGDSAFATVSLFRPTGSPRQPVSRVTWNLVLRRQGGTWRVLPNLREVERT